MLSIQAFSCPATGRNKLFGLSAFSQLVSTLETACQFHPSPRHPTVSHHHFIVMNLSVSNCNSITSSHCSHFYFRQSSQNPHAIPYSPTVRLSTSAPQSAATTLAQLRFFTRPNSSVRLSVGCFGSSLSVFCIPRTNTPLTYSGRRQKAS